MKKNLKNFQNKRHQSSQAIRSKKRTIKFKKHRLSKNRNLLGKRGVFRNKINSEHTYYDYKKVIVPENFSFLAYPEEVIAFISKLKTYFDKKQKVFIVMKNVRLIDYSAIVVLLSIVVRFKSQKIKFNGDFPYDKNVKNVFIASGFFETLNREVIKDMDSYTLGRPNTIYTHAMKNVDSELALKIMQDISPKIIGYKAIYKGLSRTLVELMQNSFNHAVPMKEGDKHWWLSVNVSEQSKIASFSFIDYGVGIFESLNHKTPDSKWFNWKKFINLFTGENNNSEILELILTGALHQTVTGQPFRGKGLPGIKQAMDRNLISRLFVITNNVYANVEEKNYKLLPHNFAGTFVYWEINKESIHHPWIQ